MQNVDGIYAVEILGPYGWEQFSTAFINDGKFRSASAEHFTSGTYAIDGEAFEMVGNLTQHVDTRTLFGQSDIKGLPIEFRGKVEAGVIDGEARVIGNGKFALRFRLNRLPVLH